MKVRDVLRPALGEDGGEDVLLVVEVVVDEPIGDPRLLCDVRHLGSVKPGAREHLGGRGDDPFTGLRAARGAGRMARRLRRLAHAIAPAARSEATSPAS